MHTLIGTVVKFARPVILREGYARHDGDGKAIEHVPAQLSLQPTTAIVVGVEEQAEGAPRLHLAFFHPDRQQTVQDANWRAVFDRVMSVRPEDDPAVQAEPMMGFYRQHTEEDEDAEYLLQGARSHIADLQTRVAELEMELEAHKLTSESTTVPGVATGEQLDQRNEQPPEAES